MAKDRKSAYKGYDHMTEDKAKAEKARLDSKKEAAVKNAAGQETNDFFATHNEEFRAACEKAGCQPTARQASKWRRKRGLAFTNGR